MPSKNKKQTEQSRVKTAIEYRMMGHGYAQIAEAMTEDTKTEITEAQVVDWVAKGLAAIHREPKIEQVILDLERVNTLLTKAFENASAGDSAAAGLVLALMKRKEELEAKLVPVKPKEESLFAPIKDGEKDKGGRPTHVPTERSVTLVEAHVVAGTPHEFIAKHLGISIPTLKKRYADLLGEGKSRLKAEAGGTLVQHWRRGNLSALIFYLKTQCGYKETQALEHAGAGGEPLPSVDMMKLPLVQFIFSEEALPDNSAMINGTGAGNGAGT